MTETSKRVFDYVKGLNGEKVTANDIADATGLGIRQVNGAITAFARVTDKKPAYMVRVPAEIELEDGTHKTVKFVELTEEGKAFVPAEA